MKKLLPALLLACTLPALADNMPLPANTPASFKNECGSCHLAYPPALLAPNDWQKTMSQLENHFGSDASVDRKTQQEISQFLQNNADTRGRMGPAGDPPRISKTSRFIRKHREISAKSWADPRIKSAANCEACHRGAANGRFSEHDILIPGLGR